MTKFDGRIVMRKGAGVDVQEVRHVVDRLSSGKEAHRLRDEKRVEVHLCLRLYRKVRVYRGVCLLPDKPLACHGCTAFDFGRRK